MAQSANGKAPRLLDLGLCLHSVKADNYKWQFNKTASSLSDDDKHRAFIYSFVLQLDVGSGFIYLKEVGRSSKLGSTFKMRPIPKTFSSRGKKTQNNSNLRNDAFPDNSSLVFSDSLLLFRTIAVNHLFALVEVEITAGKKAQKKKKDADNRSVKQSGR